MIRIYRKTIEAFGVTAVFLFAAVATNASVAYRRDDAPTISAVASIKGGSVLEVKVSGGAPKAYYFFRPKGDRTTGWALTSAGDGSSSSRPIGFYKVSMEKKRYFEFQTDAFGAADIFVQTDSPDADQDSGIGIYKYIGSDDPLSSTPVKIKGSGKS